MIDIAGYDPSPPNRRAFTSSGGQPSWITDFIGAEGSQANTQRQDGFLPQAFLIQLPPGGVSRSHFHTQDQFQVIAQGDGTLGRHAVKPVCVHYTNKYTGYGPITAGEQGLGFFTLRQIYNMGAHYLHEPDSRSHMDRSAPKRQITAQGTSLATTALMALGSVHIEELIPTHDDGLAAWLANVPPGGEVSIERHPRAGGRFYMVMAGTLSYGGKTWGHLSTLFATPDDAIVPMRAGYEGLQLLVMQYPEIRP